MALFVFDLIMKEGHPTPAHEPFGGSKRRGAALFYALIDVVASSLDRGPHRGSGPFLFPERFVQFAASPHLVHVRGNTTRDRHPPSAGPSLLEKMGDFPHVPVF